MFTAFGKHQLDLEIQFLVFRAYVVCLRVETPISVQRGARTNCRRITMGQKGVFVAWALQNATAELPGGMRIDS